MFCDIGMYPYLNDVTHIQTLVISKSVKSAFNDVIEYSINGTFTVNTSRSASHYDCNLKVENVLLLYCSAQAAQVEKEES